MFTFVSKMLRGFLKLFKRDISEKAIESLTQFLLFCIVGLSNTVISYLLNVAVLMLLTPYHLTWDYIAGNLVAFLLSVLWSFYWNNRMVFTQKEGQHRSLGKTLLKTYAAYGFTGIILNNLLSWLWIEFLHVSKYIAPLINLIVSVPLNFVMNKLWAFRGKEENPPQS